VLSAYAGRARQQHVPLRSLSRQPGRGEEGGGNCHSTVHYICVRCCWCHNRAEPGHLLPGRVTSAVSSIHVCLSSSIIRA
jgi:hypothetical protein